MIFLHYLTFVLCIIMLAIFISMFVLFSETHADYINPYDQSDMLYGQVETIVPYANRNNEIIQIHSTLSGDSGWHTCTCKDGSTFECQSNQGDGAD